MKVMTTDVLVIGNGAAGIRAALSASRAGAAVTLVGKRKLGEAGSSFSQVSRGWGIQALVGNERSEENLEAFYEDIVRVGLGRCQTELVRLLVEESGPRFEDLLSFGVQFRRDAGGKFLRAKGCFSDHERAFLAHDLDNIKASFASILQQSSVRIMEAQALQLITEDGCCWGSWVLTPANELIGIMGKATILTSGGGAGIFCDNLVGDDDIGEGYALAHRAGALIQDLEFIQFMLGLKSKNRRQFLPLVQLQQPGMVQDSEGRDILYDASLSRHDMTVAVAQRLTHMPFSCRDASCRVDLAVAEAWRRGDTVLWQGKAPMGSSGHFQVVHFAHAFNGGIRIDADAQSGIPRLFAAGEVATGSHGADRIGGCMMTATQVFGHRAGLAAAKSAKAFGPSRFPEISLPEDAAWAVQRSAAGRIDSSQDIGFEIRKILGKDAAILRSQTGLKRCLQDLTDCESELEERKKTHRLSPRNYFALSAMILTGKLVAQSALRREASLGSHYREDAPVPFCE